MAGPFRESAVGALSPHPGLECVLDSRDKGPAGSGGMLAQGRPVSLQPLGLDPLSETTPGTIWLDPGGQFPVA